MRITIEPDRVVAAALRNADTVWAAEQPRDGADLAEVLASLAAARPRAARRARVELAEGVAVVKRVEGLPGMKPDDLAAHVRLRSRRYFLQNGVPLNTAAAMTDDGITLAAVERPVLESIESGIAAAGLVCLGIAPAGHPDLRLETDTSRSARAARSRSITIRLALACTASLMLAAGSWIGSAAWRLHQGVAELARLRPALHAALVVRTNLDETTAALDAVAGAAAHRSQAARLLADLAAALPDSAFLTALSLGPDGGTLSGYAVSSAAAIRALERVPALSGVALDGAVTHESVAGADRERFTARFQVRP